MKPNCILPSYLLFHVGFLALSTVKLTNQVHNLTKEQLAARQVEYIDIAIPGKDCWCYLVGNCSIDFSKFKSERTGRGPLTKGWQVGIFCTYSLILLFVSHETLACIFPLFKQSPNCLAHFVEGLKLFLKITSFLNAIK